MNKSFSNSVKENIWIKLSLVTVITLLLMIPIGQISGLIGERENYSRIAKQDIAEKWAREQTTGGVYISIPVTKSVVQHDEKGKLFKEIVPSRVFFLPHELKVKVDTKTVVRYRGIHKVPLYKSQIQLSGNFKDIKKLAEKHRGMTIFWDEAEIQLGVSDLRGIEDVDLKWNGKKVDKTSGFDESGFFNGVVKAPIPNIKKENGGKFYIDLGLRGSDSMSFYPFGNTTDIEMNSNWGSPSFTGSYLPSSREIEKGKFKANWKINGLTRNIPKTWEGQISNAGAIKGSIFGVSFFVPIESYQLNTRAVKYSFLFVLLTFITMFFVEVIFRFRFHPLHYVMTGGSLSLFYLLLLSGSEHIGFGLAYGVAAFATLGSISLYLLGVTKLKKASAIIFGQLSIIYGFLYILLQLEEYTLVFGASGLWIIIAVLMYTTRKVDWFKLGVGVSKKVNQ